MNKGPGVYSIKCLATGEVYIGSAVNMLRRVKEHIRDLNHGHHANGSLQAEWERYTQDGFDFTVIEALDDTSQVRIREQYWIDTLNPTFNISRIVEQPGLGLVKSPATLEKLSKALKKSHARLTPEQKAERRQQVSAGWQEWWNGLTDEERDEARKRRSRPHTEETKKRLREATLANPSRGMLGKSHDEAVRAKLSEVSQAEWDKTKAERVAAKERARAEFEAGMDEREAERRRKLSVANSGKTRTNEQKQRLREVALAQQADPDYRRKHAEGLAVAMSTPEMRQKLSEAHKGKTLSEEHKAAIGAATLGKKRSPETIARMKSAQQARRAQETPAKREEIRQAIIQGVQGRAGKPHTEESKRKISETKKRKAQTPK